MQGLANSVEDIQTIYSFILSPPPPALFAIFSSWLAGPCGCWSLKFSGVLSFQGSFYFNFFDSPVFCLTSFMSLSYHT